MPRIARQASVAWEGSLSRGAGVASATSSGAFELPIDLPSRISDAPGKTSPEELLAAAHAG
jgi:lipoyl-dependent peroxiredoxin